MIVVMDHNERDDMAQDEMMQDTLILVEALFAIAHESEEAETVRLAFGALSNSAAGMSYLRSHPLNA